MASVLRQVQEQVAQQLRESEQLSALSIYSEDQRDLEFEIKNALGRQGIVVVVTTPRATYMGKLDNTSIAWQLDELEIDVVENVPVNRFKKDNYLTGQEAAMAVFDILCPLDGGREGQICPVRYEQGQDSGLLVSRCILKCLVTSDEQPGPEPTPQIKKWFVKLLDEAPADGTALQNGWMWQTEDGFVVVKDGMAQALGGVSFDQMSSYVDSATSSFLSAEDVYVRSSQYAPMQTWKAVEDTAVKTSDGNLFMPDGSVYALSRLELEVDGNVSSVQLSATPQYSVDGKGHYTYIGQAYTTVPQPYYFQTAGGITLELGFNVDGQGIYGVVVVDQTAGQIVAQQPWHEPVTECNLEFDYGGSRCKVKATNMYSKASDLNNFVREFLGIPDDGSTVPTTLQLMEVSASLSDYYVKSETSSSSEISTVFETKADISSIPTKTSQLSNDSDFITSRQVKPYDTMIGYAKNSLGSLFLFGRNDTIVPNENIYVTMDFNNGDKLIQVERTYPSWFLTQFQTTTFDPPLEMEYRYVNIYTWRVGLRTYRQYIGSNCWVAHSGTNCYYIKADENGNALPVFYVKSVEHPITFGEYELSIETMDGETGNIGCTRESTLPVTVSQRYIAYEDDVSAALSAKADLSSLGGYLPAKFSGPNDEYAAVQKIVEIQDVRSSSYNEPVLALVQNGSQRSLEIINSSSMAILDLGILSSGVPKISFGFDDPETFNTVYFQNKSGTLAYLSDLSAKADLSSLSSYLPLSGGQVNGNLSVGTGVQVFNEADGGVVKISDGSSNQTFYQHNKIATPNGNLYYPASIPEQDETLATCEWTSRNYTKISAMTEDEYEQITPDPTTLYVITED